MSTALSFLGVGEPDYFRCRVYGGDVARDANELERHAFVQRLATTGVIDCPAYDEWIAALDARGWVAYRMEPNPTGEGRVKRWRLTDVGREQWEGMQS